MMTAVMALLLMAGTSAFAQENKSVAPPRERPTTEQLARKATDRMTAQLKLTEKQAEQAYEATLERLQADEALGEQARAAKMKEAEAMKSILSTEQFMRRSFMRATAVPEVIPNRISTVCCATSGAGGGWPFP